MRTNMARETLETLKQSGLKLFDTIIPPQIKVAESPAGGKSLFVYDGKGKAASAYSRLADEIMK
jgi:chromosome partitioning protein